MTFLKGIDVSRYQPNVDWAKVKAAGISFVVVKASEANFADPMFATHWAGAKAAGLLRGSYHFLRATVDGLKQADAFLKTLGDDTGDLPPVLDIESPNSNPAQFAQYSKAFLDAVETKVGRKPVIYTAAWYWDSNMLVNGKYPAWASDYAVWVAAYPYNEPTLDDISAGKAKPPTMPKSWPTWTFWQYSEKGRVDGVTNGGRLANVDLNVFNGDQDKFNDWLGKAAPVPVVPDSAPVTVDAHTAMNIQIISAFTKAFGNLGGQLLQGTGLLSSLTANPGTPYSGPQIDDMTGLTAQQKLALKRGLLQVLSGN